MAARRLPPPRLSQTGRLACDLGEGTLRAKLELALRLRAAALARRALTFARVLLAVERLAAPLRRLAHEPLHLGDKLGRSRDRRRLIHDAHLERAVLRPRPRVPVTAGAVS